MTEREEESSAATAPPSEPADFNAYCPVCSEPLIHVKCKVVCRSAICVYRLIFNCSEF